MIWTEEQDNLLRELKPKYSAAEIASVVNKRFDVDVSRNAIIGRLHRLGLRSPARIVKTKIEKPKTSPRGTSDATLAKKIKASFRDPQINAEKPESRSAPVVSKRKFITCLDAGECRWPDDQRDPNTGRHTFCGNKTADGMSYCADHALINFSAGTLSERSAVRAATAIARTAP